ncbi:hypothetical protein BC830DRAFT_1167453 [Chytriomyces sp. MP71]|nr:hypothetical protein BC830DRAFT_1167453 [Chytriomyces sp. MP71]
MSSVLQSACDTEGSTACYHDPLVNKNGIVQCLDGTVSFVSFCPLFRQSSGLTGCTVAAEGIAACVESTTLAELNTVDAEDSATWSTSIFKEQITPNTAEESAKTELNDLIAPTSATITVTTEGPATTREPSGYISGSTADSASATVLTMDISGASMLL